MSETVADDTTASLQAKFPAATLRESLDHPAVNVPPDGVAEALQWLKQEAGYNYLVDVTAVDWSEEASPRFTIIWHVYSTTSHRYIRVAMDCADDVEPTAPTVTHLWPSANWHERETYDLMGVTFTDHPDLRRILMWDSYPHHPLRKDFPLAGIETELPDIEVAEETQAKVIAAPMMGGPFVASSKGEMNMTDAEPRAKDESWNEKLPKPE